MTIRALVLILSIACSCRTAPAGPAAQTGSAGQSGSSRPANAALPQHEAIPQRIERFTADWESLQRFHDAPLSLERTARLRAFLDVERADLERVDRAQLDVEGRVDLALLANRIAQSRARLDRADARRFDVVALAPYAPRIVALLEARQRAEVVDARAAATELDAIARAARAARETLEKATEVTAARSVGFRTARELARLRSSLDEWRAFRSGYDPSFDWWVAEPARDASARLQEHENALRKLVAKLELNDRDTILGDPIGRDALLEELRFERIAHTPEELVAMARSELAWCRAEYEKAAAELGFGADWRAALTMVKERHVAPGEQPELVRTLAREAITFLEARELVTVPPIAAETWRMSMLSAESQRVSPFFLGGELVQVSFPTASMPHEDKLMSLRANNRAFSRAVVHHELIPGHHLQGFMTDRHATHRRAFSTPFWTEGWALYWEMLLWDLGFARTPDERIGMLFWRSHRCARIVFSLSFHLGTMTEAECVELLVAEVGHERRSAEGEVRRSFGGDYGPLYQAAYLTGGMQFRALHQELVASGRMTNRAFHDAILQGGNIPVEFVRARLLDVAPEPEADPSWRFLEAR